MTGMVLSDNAVRFDVEFGSEIHINLSPRKTRRAEEISMVDEDL
jgi:hypothetical protein